MMNRQTVLKGLLALALISPALALGAVHPPVIAAVLMVGAGLFLFIAFDGRYRSTLKVDLAGALLLGGTAGLLPGFLVAGSN